MSLEPVTLVISERVRSGRIDEYESWVSGINHAVKAFDGFIGVDIIRPREAEHPEYVIIVRFDTYAHLKAWEQSETYHHWIQQSKDLVDRETHAQPADGLELWFTLPQHQTTKAPAYYKLVLVGVLAVYPLVLFVNWALALPISRLHPLLGTLLSVFAISALLTWPVMPVLTRLLRCWLYPKK